MRKESVNLFKKNKVATYVALCLFATVLSYILLYNQSKISYELGNIFFGRFGPLYNRTLANFFFWQASYPLIGTPISYAHHQLSRTYFIEGNLESALFEAHKELELHPDSTGTYYILGLTYGYNNQEKLAIENFGKYIDTHPNTWAARNDKAWLEFRIGDVDAAIETITPVVSFTGNPWVQNTYGTLLMNKGNYKEAKKAFENALKIVNTMTEKGWGMAYPGNDPRIYTIGLSAMKTSIRKNLLYVTGKIPK